MKQQELFSVPKAADHCGLHRATLWNYVNAGEIKTFKTPGGQHRIHPEDLEDFMRRKGVYPFVREDAANNKILIVDDDPAIQKFLNRLLPNHGFIIETALDGFEGGSKVESFKPGLMILDLFMPGLDGFEVCRRIKQDPAKAGIRIVAITGLDSDAIRERILDLGADGYVSKPIDKNELLAVINTVTKKIEALIVGVNRDALIEYAWITASTIKKKIKMVIQSYQIHNVLNVYRRQLIQRGTQKKNDTDRPQNVESGSELSQVR